ncbi:MAG: hypothetical protein NT126_02200 [Bacteroidetes bacterium]|nr:hypothetical protein [Bacteroidota bacterium]
MLKKLTGVWVLLMISCFEMVQASGVKTANDISPEVVDNSTTQETFFWLLGAILVILIIFVIVLALAKGTMALSENLGDKYPGEKQVS